MKKRILSMLLCLCMMLTLFPATAFAEGSEEPAGIPVCTCETACAADAMNADCPVCGAENAQPADCGKWEAPLVETTAVQKVQALIDALPDADTITAENRAEVEAQLTAIDEAKSALTDGELDTLDFTRYQAAVTALNTLDGQSGAETPKTLETSTWKLEYITAVGNGDGNWLNGESWSVDSDSNKMTEVSTGVWEIKYNDIDEFENYQVKFACNGSWQPYNWTSDGVLDGQDNPSHEVEEDGSMVTLRIDVNDFDFVTGTGSVKTEFIVTAPGDLPAGVSTEDGLKDALEKGGNIILNGDITISSTLTVSKTVTLDLNGHVLKYENADTMGSVIKVESSGNLTLMDSNPTSTHSGTSLPAGGIITGGKGTPITYGDAYLGCQYFGGGIYNQGTFTMNGGTITGCGFFETYWDSSFEATVYYDTYGGGVYNTGTFLMNGGTIHDCKAVHGGGVTNLNATFTMSGGSITGCAGGLGTGVHNYGIFTISGTAKIENCTTVEDYYSSVVFQEGRNRVKLYANGGTIEGKVFNDSDADDGEYSTITRSEEATDYTTFNGTVTGGGTIDPAACPYTVTFNYNYGGSTSNTQKVLKGQKAAEPADPTRDGWTFGGWYKESACTNEWNFDTRLTGTLTLYAKWTHNAHYDSNSDHFCDEAGCGYEMSQCSFTVENKDATGALKTVGDCQHEAVYYKSCSVCGAVSTSETDTFNGDKDPNIHIGTLGEWQKDANGHWKVYDCCPTVKGAEGTHSFDDGKCECGAVKYTVTFDANGGRVDTASTTTDIYGKLTALPAPTRSGSYRFDGWFTEKDGGTAVTTDTVFTANATVYAHWTYTGGSGYTYCTIKATAGEGGSISPSGSASVRYGSSKTFTITPDSGYAIADVKIDGQSIGAVTSYTFSNVKMDHNIKAVFMKATGNPQTGVDVPFTDVNENDWFYEDVAYVYEKSLMNGTGSSLFSPDVTTTRGMIVTILYRLEGEPSVSGNCPFEDVKAGSYCEKAIIWAEENDIVSGYGNGKFGPDDPITREQMAVILYRYAQYKTLDVSVGEDTNILSYNDAPDISEYAFSAMQWICGEGIMKGSDGNLMPQGNATRAQVAALLHRFCEEILK